MVFYTLFILFIITCLVLVASVLLQPGKSDAGALFTSNISSTAFGPRGTQSVLARITIGAAVSFMLLAFLLSQPALTGNVGSVLDRTTAPADANSNANTNANVATDANTNANTAVSTDANTNANTAVVTNTNTAPVNANTNANTKTNANKK